MLICYTNFVVVQSIAITFKAKIRKPYHDISFNCDFCIQYSVTVYSHILFVIKWSGLINAVTKLLKESKQSIHSNCLIVSIWG